jgi:hypothetical protein
MSHFPDDREPLRASRASGILSRNMNCPVKARC